MSPGGNRRLTSLLTLRLGFGRGVFSRCQSPTGSVKHHLLGPFLVRLDPDMDALTQRRGSSASHWAGALLENRSTRIAEIGFVLPQAVVDPGGIGNVAAAEPECVGRTGCSLFGVPQFSWAKAVVAQDKTANTAINDRSNLKFMSNHSSDWCRFLKVISEPLTWHLDSSYAPALTKLNTGM